MSQEITNKGDVTNQLNIEKNEAPISLVKKSRFSKRFEKLNIEVTKNSRCLEVMEELKNYLTKLDGVDLAKKLKDGGFSFSGISKATRRKEQYWKKLEKNKFFESAQWINSYLFAKITTDFENFVERPLIKKGASLDEILDALFEKVVQPILDLLNDEGEHDSILNYTADDVYGMIYFLTGKCHINWADYDNL